MIRNRDAQQREELDALLEDREPLNLETGKIKGLESADPQERQRARIALLEQKKREAQRRAAHK